MSWENWSSAHTRNTKDTDKRTGREDSAEAQPALTYMPVCPQLVSFASETSSCRGTSWGVAHARGTWYPWYLNDEADINRFTTAPMETQPVAGCKNQKYMRAVCVWQHSPSVFSSYIENLEYRERYTVCT